MSEPPDGLPSYRVLTGPDDERFCRRVSEAMALGYRSRRSSTVAIMSDTEHTETLRAAERRLQAAQLSSDVTALGELLDDAVLFTGPDGNLYTKDDDLGAHRSGQQTLTRVEESELRVLVSGTTGVTWFLGTLEGAVGGESFSARLRYTRTWARDVTGWRIVAAHAMFVDAS